MKVSDLLPSQRQYLKLMHFTPQHKPSWCWCFVAPCMTLLPGLQPVITGGYVEHAGSMLWEGIAGLPRFATRDDADQWAQREGFAYGMGEVEE